MQKKAWFLLGMLVLLLAGKTQVHATETAQQNTLLISTYQGPADKSGPTEEADCQETVIEADVAKATHLADGDRSTYLKLAEETTIIVKRTDGLSGLYIEFDRVPQPWTVKRSVSDIGVCCGENGFLHEYVDVAELFGTDVQEVQLVFPAGTVIADIYGFSQGQLPDWVQNWEPPLEQVDLLLFTTHSDDEQLFFSGLLPYYTIERGLRVQVAYGVQHFEAAGVANHVRPHEQLDGLWKVGVTHYPVMSEFPDLYAESKDRAVALAAAKEVFGKAGVTYEDMVGYLTECLRRFKPLVVVSHDLDGEYGHGAHVFLADALTVALKAAAVAEEYPESAVQYGTWQVEKTYLHLYPENPIVMDYDTPYESMGGRTPFEVSQEGFGCHKSQHWTWFNKWMNGTPEAPITKASQIKSYSPCKYGLYQTEVGLDEQGGDFFEHVKTYDVREEEARLAEEARLKALEEEQRAKEEAQAWAEEERLAAEAAAAAASERQRVIFTVAAGAGVLLVGVSVILLFRRKKKV